LFLPLHLKSTMKYFGFTPLSSLLVLFPLVAKAATIVAQAEDGVRVGNVVVDTAIPGYSGKGYVPGFQAASDSVTVTVNITTAGLYDLNITYAAPYGTKKGALLLNGSPNGEFDITSVTWANATAGQVLLAAGTNTIGVQSDWGWYLIDAFLLTPTPKPAPHRADVPPVDAKVTTKARNLLQFIQKKVYGKLFLTGQHDSDNASIKWLEQNIGKAPAMGGYDFIDYSPSRVEHGLNSTAVEDSLAWAKRGGIVTFQWHWNAPTGLIDQPGKEWWRGFYTDSTTFDIAATLANKSGANYTLLIRDIDAIAVQLKRIAATNVPIIFRPLHEAEGGWFWWGAKGPGPCKELYNILYNRIVNFHQIHNIIWMWNSVSPDWYPGDNVTDILAYDSYPTKGDHGAVSNVFRQLVSLGKDRKIVALAEVGSIPDPDISKVYYADWAFYMTWNGEYTTDGQWNSVNFTKAVYNHPQAITLSNLKKYYTP